MTRAPLALFVILASCGDEPAPRYSPNPDALEPPRSSATAYACPDGGAPTWSQDIVPNMAAGVAWHCADMNCHGPGSVNPPTIDPTNASALYASLAATPIENKPYLKSGSTNADDSSFVCTLDGTCAAKMPLPPGIPLTAAQMETIRTWIACGAPNN